MLPLVLFSVNSFFYNTIDIDIYVDKMVC